MRNPNSRKWGFWLALIFLSIICGCKQEAGVSPPKPVAAAAVEVPSDPASSDDPGALTEDEAAGQDISEAPVRAVLDQTVVPPNVRRMGATAEVIKLANSGVDEGVLLSFVTNSAASFRLNADEIIYLNDLGVAPAIVNAMIERDQTLAEAVTPLPVATDSLETAGASVPAGQPGSLPGPPLQSVPAAPGVVATEMPPVPAPVEGPSPDFYDALAPYGAWIELDGYGPVWQPAVATANPAWQPYLDDGRWVYTDSEWYWMSDYSWGWGPFHYGRWFSHSRLGWCWLPDADWAPAWVAWRQTDAFVGWAPLPPGTSFKPALGLTFHGRQVVGSVNLGLGMHSFAFVSVSHFRDRHLQHFALPQAQASRVYQQTEVTTGIAANRNRIINKGIAPEVVAAATHREVPKVALQDVSAPAAQGVRADHLSLGGKTLAVFRPRTPAGPERALAMLAKTASGASQPASAAPEIVAQGGSEASANLRPAVSEDSSKGAQLSAERPRNLSSLPEAQATQEQPAAIAPTVLSRTTVNAAAQLHAVPAHQVQPSATPSWPGRNVPAPGLQNQQPRLRPQPPTPWPFDNHTGGPAVAGPREFAPPNATPQTRADPPHEPPAAPATHVYTPPPPPPAPAAHGSERGR